eukprot:COSAG01_NODE_1046_length_11949_cov_4.662700_1_plen_86_part_00
MCHAVYGSFSAPKRQEIVVAKGSVLELLRPDDNGKVQTISSTEVFGEIRSLANFRLTGERVTCGACSPSTNRRWIACCPCARCSI